MATELTSANFGAFFYNTTPTIREAPVVCTPRRVRQRKPLPVRSYLAVPVVSHGTILGGLFFGHPEAARFSDTDERIAAGIASHAAVAVGNALPKGSGGAPTPR